MGKICFLILAHKNQNQLMRLINHLKNDFDIYIHIDKNSNINFKSFDNVRIYKKINVHYAEFSQITATLFLIIFSSKIFAFLPSAFGISLDTNRLKSSHEEMFSMLVFLSPSIKNLRSIRHYFTS